MSCRWPGVAVLIACTGIWLATQPTYAYTTELDFSVFNVLLTDPTESYRRSPPHDQQQRVVSETKQPEKAPITAKTKQPTSFEDAGDTDGERQTAVRVPYDPHQTLNFMAGYNGMAREQLLKALATDSDICTIDRIQGGPGSRDLFREKYLDKRPVIIEPASSDDHEAEGHVCRNNLNLGRLQEHAGGVPVLLHGTSELAHQHARLSTLGRFISLLNASRQLDTAPNAGEPAYNHLNVFNGDLSKFGNVVGDCKPFPSVASLYPDSLTVEEVGVGQAGSGLPFHWHGPVAGNTILHGKKRWFVYPDINLSLGLNPIETSAAWILRHYNGTDDSDKATAQPSIPSELLTCTLTPGDTIYVPDGMLHQTLNLEDTVFMVYASDREKKREKAVPKGDQLPTSKVLAANMCSRSQVADASKALEQCSRALAVFPKEAEFTTFAAAAHTLTDNVKAALALLRQSVENSPNNGHHRLHLLLALMELGKLEEAIWHADAAIALGTPHADLEPCFYKAAALQRLGRQPEAGAAAESCLNMVAEHINNPLLDGVSRHRSYRTLVCSLPIAGKTPSQLPDQHQEWLSRPAPVTMPDRDTGARTPLTRFDALAQTCSFHLKRYLSSFVYYYLHRLNERLSKRHSVLERRYLARLNAGAVRRKPSASSPDDPPHGDLSSSESPLASYRQAVDKLFLAHECADIEPHISDSASTACKRCMRQGCAWCGATRRCVDDEKDTCPDTNSLVGEVTGKSGLGACSKLV